MIDSHRSPNSSNAEKNRSDTMAKSPSHSREMGGFYLIFWLRNYPHATGTRPLLAGVLHCMLLFTWLCRCSGQPIYAGSWVPTWCPTLPRGLPHVSAVGRHEGAAPRWPRGAEPGGEAALSSAAH